MYHVCTYVQQTAECRHCITIPGNSGNFGEQFSQKKKQKEQQEEVRTSGTSPRSRWCVFAHGVTTIRRTR